MYSEAFSHPSYFTPLLTIIWMLPVAALAAAALVLVGARRRHATLSLVALAWLALETVTCVISGLLARRHVSTALHDEPRKLYIALLVTVLGITVVAATCLLLDRRLSRAAAATDKPLRAELWRSALMAGALVTLLPQAWVPLILHKTEGALSAGLIFFVYVLVYDAVVVTVLALTMYRLSRHDRPTTRRLRLSVFSGAILVTAMAVLPMVLATVIALNTTPNGVIDTFGQF